MDDRGDDITRSCRHLSQCGVSHIMKHARCAREKVTCEVYLSTGRRSALSSRFWFQCAHLKRTTKRSRETIHCLFVRLVGFKNNYLSFGDAHVVVECASNSLIPKFLRVTLDTFWRARIDLCMHGLVQPQTHLQIFRRVFVNTSSRVVFEALDRRCNGHRDTSTCCFNL